MIKQLSKNKYKIIAEIGYTMDGKRKRKTEIFEGTRKQAETREFEIKQQYSKKGFITDSKNLTFEDYGKIFIKHYCEGNIGAKTMDGYLSMLEKINSYLGNWQLKSIETFTLTQLYKKLKKGTRKDVVTNNTLLHYYNLINLMFTQAVKWNFIDSNPNSNIPRPKKEKHLAECYDIDQIHTLLNGLTNECLKYQALIILAIDSGARRSEILALTWKDIDFDTKVLTINKSLDVIRGEFIEKATKNDTSTRKMVLTDTTINVLKAYREELKTSNTWKETNKLFLAKDGKPMYPTTCGKIFQKVAVKNGLPKINFHSLRHSSASLQIALGVHTKLIQERMGHSSMAVTTSIYSHIFQANRTEVANKLNGALSLN